LAGASVEPIPPHIRQEMFSAVPSLRAEAYEAANACMVIIEMAAMHFLEEVINPESKANNPSSKNLYCTQQKAKLGCSLASSEELGNGPYIRVAIGLLESHSDGFSEGSVQVIKDLVSANTRVLALLGKKYM